MNAQNEIVQNIHNIRTLYCLTVSDRLLLGTYSSWWNKGQLT